MFWCIQIISSTYIILFEIQREVLEEGQKFMCFVQLFIINSKYLMNLLSAITYRTHGFQSSPSHIRHDY